MFRAWMRHEHWVIWFTAAVVFILALLASRAERRVNQTRCRARLSVFPGSRSPGTRTRKSPPRTREGQGAASKGQGTPTFQAGQRRVHGASYGGGWACRHEHPDQAAADHRLGADPTSPLHLCTGGSQKKPRYGTGLSCASKGTCRLPSNPPEKRHTEGTGSASAASHRRNAEPSCWFLCRMADTKKPRRSGAKVTTCIVGGLSVGPLRAFLS